MALLWAAGILWFAYDFAQPDARSSDSIANAEQADGSASPHSPATDEDVQKAADALGL